MRSSSPPVVVLVLVTLVAWPLRAQTGSFRVTTPSPIAASLGKFGDVPVSLYTGTPDVSIPLFTAQGRTLSLPIVLKYHAGGVKVEEIGSWVGIGWTLEAGGTITRSVRGLVDEDIGLGYYYTGNTWYNPGDWPTPSFTAIVNLRDKRIDGEPDQFFFNFAGRSGQFVIGPTGASGPIEVRAVPYQKLRIVQSIQGSMIMSWTITTEDGTIYVFDAAETSTDYTTTSSTSETENSHWGTSHTSSWHLTSITAPGGDVITLQYADYVARHRMGYSIEKFDHRQVPQGSACVEPQFEVWSEFEIAEKRLASITTAAHTITFTPGPLREDALSPLGGAQQEPTLDRIAVATRAGVELRRFQFSYNYATSRLTLTGVAETDRNGVSLPPYSFAYNTTSLPPRTSFSLDHWGFFNNRQNSTPIPAMLSSLGTQLSGGNREPDPAYVPAGILTRITYPTGGFNEFVYEPNDYGTVGGGAVIGWIEGPAQTAQAFAGPNAGSVEQTFTITSVDPSAKIRVLVSFSQDPVGCAGMDDPPCPMTELLGTGGWQVNGFQELFLSPGTYTLRATTLEFGQQAIIDATWHDQLPAPGRIGAGLRVAEVRAADAVGNVQIKRYKYTLTGDPGRSSGDISSQPQYAYNYSSPGCSYFSRSSMSRMPLGDGPVVGYREVTVWHGANGEFGKTLHRFRSTADVIDPPPSGMWPFSRRTSYEFMRGQETDATEYNSSGQPQQHTASVHAFQTLEPVTARSFRGMSINTFSAGMFGTNYAYHAFEVLSVWSFVSEDTTIAYDEGGGNALPSVRTYTYGNPAHIQLTQQTETNSNGTERITRMKYPADYPLGFGDPEATALSAMQGTAHIHNAVIERWILEKTGGVERVVRGELTTFRQVPTGAYLPYQRFVLNSPTPLQ